MVSTRSDISLSEELCARQASIVVGEVAEGEGRMANLIRVIPNFKLPC